METSTKIEVLNPITILTKVGVFLVEYAKNAGFDLAGIYAILSLTEADVMQKSKFSVKELKAIEGLTDSNFSRYLKKIQDSYAENEVKAKASYRESKKIYSKVKDIAILVPENEREGMSMLDDILDYLDIDEQANYKQEIEEKSRQQTALYKLVPKKEVDTVNLYAWLRRGELDLNQFEKTTYNRAALLAWLDADEWRHHVKSVDYFKQLPEVFKQFGICLSLTPYLKNTVRGAVRWIEGTPLIQVADMKTDLATCWVTLFHEIGHVLKHENIDTLDGETAGTNTREKEANETPNHYLFNGDGLRKEAFKHRFARNQSPTELGAQYEVDAFFAAYWLKQANAINGYDIKPHSVTISFS